MCAITGLSTSGTIGLGRLIVRGRRREPAPPAIMTAFMSDLLEVESARGEQRTPRCPEWHRCSTASASPALSATVIEPRAPSPARCATPNDRARPLYTGTVLLTSLAGCRPGLFKGASPYRPFVRTGATLKPWLQTHGRCSIMRMEMGSMDHRARCGRVWSWGQVGHRAERGLDLARSLGRCFR
jgi:hypothetical protein